LKDHRLEPIFARMTQNLFRLLEDDWGPHRDIEDPVVWRRREYNKIADYIVTFTMDSKADFYQKCESPLPEFNPQDANFVCHSDGGSCADTCFAVAWFWRL
jgi:hypothetical protein